MTTDGFDDLDPDGELPDLAAEVEEALKNQKPPPHPLYRDPPEGEDGPLLDDDGQPWSNI